MRRVRYEENSGLVKVDSGRLLAGAEASNSVSEDMSSIPPEDAIVGEPIVNDAIGAALLWNR